MMFAFGNDNAGVYYPPPRKKKHVGLWVFLIIVLLIAAAIFYFYGSLALFPPKHLGINYTQADLDSVMKKLNVQITAPKEVPEGASINDYNWKFSNYQPRKFTLTPTEATAFFNEIAPQLWWFDQIQIKVEKGTILTSSSVDIARIKQDLYADVAGQIPVPLPEKANLYTEGDFAIHDNQISMQPDVIQVGLVPIPDQYLQGEELQVFSDYLERFITVIPDIDIKEAGLQDDGNFIFDGVIPTQIEVTPKS